MPETGAAPVILTFEENGVLDTELLDGHPNNPLPIDWIG